MASHSMRKNEVPKCLTIIWLRNATAPLGFTHDTNLQDIYFKNVLNGCTNPGCTGGSNTHSHACTGAHVHSVPGAHTHNLGSGNASNRTCDSGPQNSPGRSSGTHSHTNTSSSAGATGCSDSAGGHVSPSLNSEPPFATFKYITKSAVVALRVKDVPQDGMLLWTKPLGCIPSHYAQDNTKLDNFIKGTATDCVTPGPTGGVTTHDHGIEGNHSHTQTLATHGHTYTGDWTGAPTVTVHAESPTQTTVPSHTHSGNPTDTNVCDSSVTSDSKCHDHGSQCNNPAHTTAAIIKHSVLELRRQGVPKSAAALFNDVLANIPSDYALQDGTLGTTNTLDKMIRIIPTSCAAPATNVGANCHQHTAGPIFPATRRRHQLKRLGLCRRQLHSHRSNSPGAFGASERRGLQCCHRCRDRYLHDCPAVARVSGQRREFHQMGCRPARASYPAPGR